MAPALVAFRTGQYNFLEQWDVAHGAALRDGVRAVLVAAVSCKGLPWLPRARAIKFGLLC
jgi:hypothetical protein